MVSHRKWEIIPNVPPGKTSTEIDRMNGALSDLKTSMARLAIHIPGEEIYKPMLKASDALKNWGKSFEKTITEKKPLTEEEDVSIDEILKDFF